MTDEQDNDGLGTMFATADDTAPEAPDTSTPMTYERPPGKGGPPVTVMSRSRHHSLWGHMLWNAGREAASAVEGLELHGKAVLEIGAGMGLPSLVATLCGARLVVVTDYPEEVLLDALRANVAANCRGATNIHVQGLQWGDIKGMAAARALNGGRRFDVVILSDVVFNHVCHEQLAVTVYECLALDGVALCPFTHHRPHKATEDMKFITHVLPKTYLLAEKVKEVIYPVMFENDPGDATVRATVHVYTVRHLPLNSDDFHEALEGLGEGMDVVVDGTDVTASLLAGALARAGRRVLHLDPNDCYGGGSATMALRPFRRHAMHSGWTETLHRDLGGDRGYNLDLSPSIVLSDGALVDFLIASGVGKYLEFKNVDRVIAFDGDSDGFLPVPMCKGDMFRSKILSLKEKRILMKAVEFMSGEGAAADDGLVASYMDSISSPPRLTAWLLYAILNYSKDDNAMTIADAKKAMAMFMASVGKFGPTPYITYQYGAAEFPQACCRVCAVYEGVYILRRAVDAVGCDPLTGAMTHVVTNGQTVKAKAYIGTLGTSPTTTTTHRALVLTTSPLVSWASLEALGDTPVDDNDTALRTEYVCPTAVIVVPPGATPHNPSHAVRVMQLGANTNATPKGVYALQFVSHAPNLASLVADWIAHRLPHGSVGYECHWVVGQGAARAPPPGAAECVSGVHFLTPSNPSRIDDTDILTEARAVFPAVAGVGSAVFYEKLPGGGGEAEAVDDADTDEASQLLGI